MREVGADIDAAEHRVSGTVHLQPDVVLGGSRCGHERQRGTEGDPTKTLHPNPSLTGLVWRQPSGVKAPPRRGKLQVLGQRGSRPGTPHEVHKRLFNMDLRCVSTRYQ